MIGQYTVSVEQFLFSKICSRQNTGEGYILWCLYLNHQTRTCAEVAVRGIGARDDKPDICPIADEDDEDPAPDDDDDESAEDDGSSITVAADSSQSARSASAARRK
jgi:hypothetical protein